MANEKIEVRLARSEQDFLEAKTLILDYVTWLGMDLSFQNFDSEMANLKNMYSESVSGGLLIVIVDGKTAGVAGIRKFEGHDSELKRMFVKEEFRNLGVVKQLMSAAIELAKKLHYKTVKLDTADFMTAAIKLYKMNGFVEIPAYRHNPHESAKYFQLTL